MWWLGRGNVIMISSMDFTAREMEILCQLSLQGNADAAHFKKQVAQALAEKYQTGTVEVVRNTQQAKKYFKIADPRQVVAADAMEFYTTYGWFNRARLALVRTYRVTQSIGSQIMDFATSILPMLSISMGFRLFVNLGACVRSAIFPDEPEKSLRLSAAKRFMRRFNEGERAKQIRDDGVWFLINLTALILAFPTMGSSFFVVTLVKALSTSAAVWDVINEALDLRKMREQTVLLTKIDKKIVDLYAAVKPIIANIADREEKIAKLEKSLQFSKKINSTFERSAMQKINALKLEVQNLKNQDHYKEYQKYVHIKERLHAERKTLKNNLMMVIGLTFLTAVSVALFFFPPTSAVMMAGAVGALVFGSVLSPSGFVRSVVNAVKNWFVSPREEVVVAEKKAIPVVTPSLTLSDKVVASKMLQIAINKPKDAAVVNSVENSPISIASETVVDSSDDELSMLMSSSDRRSPSPELFEVSRGPSPSLS